MNDISKLVRMVISTLNTVEVKGKDNLDKMLGSINALESIAKIMDAAPAADQEEDKEESNGG